MYKLDVTMDLAMDAAEFHTLPVRDVNSSKMDYFFDFQDG